MVTKVCMVKAMVFPVFVSSCESWTLKKTEHQRTDAFELWCWRRLLRVPRTERTSTLNIDWKDWCWSWSSNTMATWCKEPAHWKDTDTGEDLRQMEKTMADDQWLDSITDSMDLNLSKLEKIVEDRGAWHAAIHGVTRSWTQLSYWKTTTNIMN